MRFAEGEPMPAIISVGKGAGSKEMSNAAIDDWLGKSGKGITDRMMGMQGVGIESRYWAGETQATSDLAVEAIKEAMVKAHITPEDVSALWVGTSSPDYLGVSTASIVQDKLNLPKDIAGSNNADACPGFVVALYRACVDLSSPLGRGGDQIAVGAEKISGNLDPKKPMTGILFGDAAGAVVVRNVIPDKGAITNMGFAFGLDGAYADSITVEAGGSVLPASAETVAKGQHALVLDGPVVLEQATARMPEVGFGALKEAGLSVEDVDWLIPHQANLKIMKAVAESLGIPEDRVINTIRKYGNTSAASIPTALYEGIESGKVGRNDVVLVVAFGAGLVYAGSVFPMVGLPQGEKTIFQGVDIASRE